MSGEVIFVFFLGVLIGILSVNAYHYKALYDADRRGRVVTNRVRRRPTAEDADKNITRMMKDW